MLPTSFALRVGCIFEGGLWGQSILKPSSEMLLTLFALIKDARYFFEKMLVCDNLFYDKGGRTFHILYSSPTQDYN